MRQQEYDRELDTAPLEAYDYTLDAPARHAPRRRGATMLGLALILIGVLWIGSSLATPRMFWPFDSRTLLNERAPAQRVELDVGPGDVDIVPWNQPEAQIVAESRGWNAPRISVEKGDGVVRVRADQSGCLWLCWSDVRYRVSLPAGDAVTVRTTSGDVRVAGAGATTVTTVSGDVRLADLHGPLSVVTTSGDVEQERSTTQPAEVRTTSGDITLDGVSGAVAARSISGDITIRGGRDATLTAETTSGDIRYEGSLALAGDNRISTVSGGVTLRLPEESGFTLRGRTVSGEISSELPLQNEQRGRGLLSGTAGAGGPSLQIETTSGDVQIERQ
jgi:DUF4097 and DUF4098 domain-containing protein YvlB